MDFRIADTFTDSLARLTGDNLSGVRSLEAAVDGQAYAAVSFDSAGRSPKHQYFGRSPL